MATLKGNSVKGTMFKVNLNMEPIDGYRLANVDWSVKVFVEGKPNHIDYEKKDCVYVDDNNYLIPIDSSELGAGSYWMTLTASIPDNDFKGGIRIERRTGFTGVTIDAR